MRTSGRLAAAIEILADFEARRVPLKTALADWARGARYAGAKDRAWISGLCLDALRRRNSLSARMGGESPRALALGAMRFLWEVPLDDLAAVASEEPHGPGALTEEEEAILRNSAPLHLSPSGRGRNREAVSGEGEGEPGEITGASSPSSGAEPVLGPAFGRTRGGHLLPDGEKGEPQPHIAGDFPEWLTPHMRRVFGERAADEGAALAARADVDLRLNTLKATPEKALAALGPVKGEALPILINAARIAAPDSSERAPAVTVIPAFNKGWVEVQDLGSQIAAAAAGAVKGAQTLDYCAGGGGKTLALAALMENTGQLYAYDRDALRLKPLYERAKRAGIRNLQVRNPAGGETLDDLEARMDAVFVDAPCTGSGAWRRHPDTKWRLTPQQLERRMGEQDAVLAEAARFVKPGGRLVYVTCSVFIEENEDRVAAFLGAHPDFAQTPAFEAVAASGLMTEEGRAALGACATPDGALRLTPARLRADGFFIAVLARRV